jgi:ribose-phosphate pyrophosphokinase
LKYACEFINSLKFDTVYVVEPHSDVTCALLDRARPVWIVEHIVERVKKAIDFNDEKDYLVFPDAGAAKRYENLQTARSYVGFKLRDFKTGDIIKHSFVEVGVNADYLPVTNGCKALIIDDLCSRGATFIAASKELRKLGFAEVHLLVAHCEENVYTGSLFDYVDSVHATTSLQVESQHPKLHLHPIEDLLYECL